MGTVTGSKRVVRRFPARVMGPGVYSSAALAVVRKVLQGIISRKLTGPTKDGRFDMSKGANATRISRKGTKCGTKKMDCLIDFYNCFPSRTPGCDYVMSVRVPRNPTSKNLRTNDMFDQVTRHVCTGRLCRSLTSTGSSASVVVPRMGGKSLHRTSCMLRGLGVRDGDSDVPGDDAPV